MVFRRDLRALLTNEPRSVSSLARQLGLPRGDVDEAMRHALRSARAAGQQVLVIPAECRTCGFTFGPDRLSKPGKCPNCKGTRILEAQVGLSPPAEPNP